MIPKFYLEDPRKEGICYIRVRIRIGKGRPVKVYLPPEIKIERSSWDHKSQTVKHRAPNSQAFNIYLNDLRTAITAKWWELKNSNNLTAYEMDRSLRLIVNGKTEEDIFEVFEMLSLEKKNNPQFSKSLYQKYSNITAKLKSFRPKATFADVNHDFLGKWVNNLFTEHELATNTVSRYVVFFQTLMNESKRRGYHDNEAYKGFSVKRTKTVYPYLTLEELDKIYAHDFSNDDHLHNTKILLLKGCYSGQRFSDWHKVRPSNIVNLGGDDYYRISTKKTRDVVNILAFDKLRHLVNMEARTMSLTKFNIHVKTVCEKAGIKQPFVRQSYKGNIMKDEEFSKYQVVTSHIGRRSFVCNSLLAGVPEESIKKVGGWKTDAAFRKYIQLSSVDGLQVFKTAFN